MWLGTLIGCGKGSTSASSSPPPAPQDFALVVSPGTITGTVGSTSLNFTVSVTGQNGFSNSVSIAVTGLPAGVSISPASPFSVGAGNNQPVTFSIPTTATPGTYAVTVSGTSGSLAHSAALSLTVPTPDFAIAVSPGTITNTAGATSNFTVSVPGQNGFSGSVSVAISGLPAGASTSPASPFTVVGGSNQTVNLSVPSTATPGTYAVTVSGTSGSLAHSAGLSLTVPTQDFSLTVAPTAVTANVGTSTSSFTTSIASVNGFSDSVTMSLSGLPPGATTSPASPFTVAADTDQTVTLTVPTTAFNGLYTITATGTSGSLTHSAPLGLTVLGQKSVTTWHYDNGRSGAYLSETTLTPSNVNSATFGKLATFPVDGFIVGHPLYLQGVNIPGQGVHNVVYVATMHDSVYAFDADSTNTTPLWMTSILNYSPAGATTVPATVKKNAGTTGWSEVGIVSTPVIDPVAGIIYVLAETYEGPQVVHRLHAFDVATGLESLGGPATIAASYTLNGAATTFADLYEMNRPGLLLASGHVYIAFGSNCCNNYSQGWVLSYNAATLQQEGAYVAEPGKTLASIWQQGAGISADNTGNVYAETSEGPYAPPSNLAISVIKLSQTGTTLAVSDWFTPYNYQYLSTNDWDLANTPVVLPDQSGPYPHEAVAVGKLGTIYLLNRDNMGQLCTTCDTAAIDTQIIQEIPSGTQGNTTPVYWNNTLYFSSVRTPVTAYTVSDSRLVIPSAAQSAAMVGPSHPVITANGNTSGVLWLIDSLSHLLALDATTLNTLYDSRTAANGRDSLPPVPHFACPIAADGKIFIGTQDSVVVYGLL